MKNIFSIINNVNKNVNCMIENVSHEFLIYNICYLIKKRFWEDVSLKETRVFSIKISFQITN